MSLISSPERPVDRYLKWADDQADLSPCLRRKTGAVLVSRDEQTIVCAASMPPAGVKPCTDCHMTTLGIPDTTRLDCCRAVHAEARVLLDSPWSATEGAIVYVAALDPDTEMYSPEWPCPICARLLQAAGVDAIVIATMAGPRMITPEHLVESHERGFHRALNGATNHSPHSRVPCPSTPVSDPLPGIRMIDHPRFGKMVSMNGHDWVFAYEAAPGQGGG